MRLRAPSPAGHENYFQVKLLAMISFLFAPLAIAAAIEPAGGCGFILRKPEVAAHYSIPAGKLHLCGAGTLKKFQGEIYFESGENRKLVAEEGGPPRAPAPFDLDEVEISALSAGIAFTHSVPFERTVRLPSFRTNFLCEKSGACHYEKKECIFSRLKGNADEAALARLKKHFEMEKIPFEVKTPLEALAKKAGTLEAHPLEKVANPDAFDLDEMKVFRNALLGHRPSQKFFFDPKWQKRDQWREEHSAFGDRKSLTLDQAIRQALAELKTAHCLP